MAVLKELFMTAVFHEHVLLNVKSTTLMLLSGVSAGAEIQRF
jgi:hypothetical protein